MKTKFLSPTIQRQIVPADHDLVETSLQSREMLAIEGEGRLINICVDKGTVWMTQEGDSQDHILSNGEHYVTMQPGRIIIQAMPSASIRITRHDWAN